VTTFLFFLNGFSQTNIMV